ncbi:hypothetical protein ID866_11414 [Astraeus odoratus]|nr:hypothetical protein ID866_11414 [Astraeus odoratus]
MDLKKLHEPQAFRLDSWKVSFALSFLKGIALSFLKGIALTWFEPNLLNAILGAEPAWADDYSEQPGNSSGTASLSSTGKKPQQPSPSSPKPSSDSSMPDLSGVLGKDGKLTAAEHLRHIKNALCLFCGLPGHSAKDCPRSTSCMAKACTTQAASVTASTAETPAEVKK